MKNLNRKKLIPIVVVLLAVIIGTIVYADYCYTSGLKGKIVTFVSPKFYNFDFGTVYNDEYTKAGEPYANFFDITDSTLKWYVPSGNWGLQASFLNETFWKQYFISLTVSAIFKDFYGKQVASITMGYTQTVEYPNPTPMFIISGAKNGTICVNIKGQVNPNLTAGEIVIPCTAIIEWCPLENP
jgi:hypothetical protein